MRCVVIGRTAAVPDSWLDVQKSSYHWSTGGYADRSISSRIFPNVDALQEAVEVTAKITDREQPARDFAALAGKVIKKVIKKDEMRARAKADGSTLSRCSLILVDAVRRCVCNSWSDGDESR